MSLQEDESPAALQQECARLRAELEKLGHAREALRQVNQQLSLILEQQPIIPYTCQATGDFGATYIGPSIKRITGFEPHQLTEDASFWASHIHPDDRERVFAELGALFEHHHHEHEYRWQIADGSYRWFYDCLQLYLTEEGQPSHMVGAWLDVTERKLAAARLRKQERFLYTLVDTIPDLISVFDVFGRLTLANKAFCASVGVEPDAVRGAALTELLPDARGAALAGALDEVRASGSSQFVQISFDTPEGAARVVESILVPHRDAEDQQIVIVIGRDVTEREQGAKALRAAKERAEFASRSKTEFLANMSHEIRTPLNSILGYSQLLSKRARESTFPDYVSEYLGHISLSGYNLSEIINNILELSKIEEGKVTLSPEPLDLSLLVQRIYDLSKLHATEKGIDFRCHYAPDLPRVVRTDQTKLTQILNNLISNALKFTPSGKRVDMDVTRVEDRIRLAVADQGIGIAEDKQRAIFEAFEQADGSISRSYGGTGLGLAICRRLSRLLGGDIEVVSSLGEGATFTVEIPLDDCTDDFERVESTEQGPRFATDSRVLVVEDNPMNQAVIRALFAELEIDVSLAEDGQAGIQKAIELQPECIFMDLHMPRLDGLQATRQLRALPEFADVPIIALTADAFAEQKDSALAVGISDYLTKPVILKELVGKLTKYLRPASGRAPKLKHVLDVTGLEEYSAQLFGQLRDMFVQMVPVELAQFRSHVAKREHTAATDQAHNLKNYGVGMCAKRFTDTARELEMESKRENWARVAELIGTLELAYEDTTEALSHWEHQRYRHERAARPALERS